MASASSSSAAGAPPPSAPPAPRLRLSRVPKRARPIGDFSLADVIAATVEQFIPFDAPSATCLVYTATSDDHEEGAGTLVTLERRTGMLCEAFLSEGGVPLAQPRFVVKEFVERVCAVSADGAPTDGAVRAARARAAEVLDLWRPYTGVEARGAHEAVVGAKPATESWKEGAHLRTTAVRRHRAEDAAFGDLDDDEADADEEQALCVTVAERRTRTLFASVTKNEVKRALQARAKMLRTPRQFDVHYYEEGALKASSAPFSLSFPGPGGGVEPSSHPRIDAFFSAIA